ncbi:hypothetical protein C5167_050621 [Papaver somniferum]|uniref:Cytochrome P450 n=1 Tax=Papaver somniferum TaxID=3469 RepID=A0A4Y7KQP2_PAPSO|nr:hypothetical protein C5167_050621 [Papaver somniferum]
MEENYYLICASSIVVSTLFFIVFVKILRTKNKKIGKNGTCLKFPPGGRGWPLIGDSLNWYNAVAGSHPPAFVEEQVKRYGRIFSCSLFGKRAVVSADPSFNRFIMLNEGKLFQSSYPKSFRDLVGKNGLITVHGEQQRKLHAIASSMMRLDKLRVHFLKDIQMVMLRTLNNLHEDQTYLLQDVCRKVAIELMVNQLMGVSSESEVNQMAGFFSDFVDGCLSVPINLPGFTYHTAMKARDNIISKIDKTVEKIKNEQLSATSEARNGVLGRLIEEQSLPDAAEQDGIRGTSGDEHMLTWEDYKAMPFTQCVIDETLRIGGIAIWLMREAKEDVEYQEYVIPKGCFVVPFLSAVHLDENIYKGAVNFNPWRWMDPDNKVTTFS